ncbi:lytic transglycosylase [Alphaproteobacteria bacterium]|nr:lytic transglycosylase [Alphaproteobacteria bacterium]
MTNNEVEILKKVSIALEKKNYEEALIYAREMKSRYKQQSDSKKINLSDALVDIVLWNKFSQKIDNASNAKLIAFSDISTFVIDNPFYPNINELRKNVEHVAIANSIPFEVSQFYFTNNPASEIESKVYLVESKIEALSRNKIDERTKDSERKNIQSQIAKIWIKENFSSEEEKSFLEKYGNNLTEIDHVGRIERLLWDSKNDDAKRIFSLVNQDYQNLFQAVIEIQDSPKYIDKIISKIPRKLRSNEILVNRQIIWLKSKDKIKDLTDLLLDLPEKTKYPEKWWTLRRLYGREMIKQKKFDIAYKMFANHNLPTTSSDFWEAQWTAGWIALRFNDEAKIALNHFEYLNQNVSQPVTLARSAYWIAMSYEAMGQKSKAIEWYKTATKYPIFFYGQLAIHKHRTIDPVGAQEDIILPKNPDITGRDMIKISESRAAQVAYLLAITGNKEDATKIFEWIVNNSPTEGQIAVIMKIVNEIGDRQIDAKISKVASRKNVFFIKDKFQIIKEVASDEHAPLVHAIIKQESGFVPSAVSKVGAIGFMQLMPATAKLVAKEAGLPYDRKKLATDISYNIKLGSHYIKKLIDRFDGSEMLAIASYNAGPNATQRWINEFYDPRQQKDLDKVVDWIELITYSETRNYVQRIMENLIVYKYLMSRNNYDDVK